MKDELVSSAGQQVLVKSCANCGSPFIPEPGKDPEYCANCTGTIREGITGDQILEQIARVAHS
jgi:hypothetical protein